MKVESEEGEFGDEREREKGRWYIERTTGLPDYLTTWTAHPGRGTRYIAGLCTLAGCSAPRTFGLCSPLRSSLRGGRWEDGRMGGWEDGRIDRFVAFPLYTCDRNDSMFRSLFDAVPTPYS